MAPFNLKAVDSASSGLGPTFIGMAVALMYFGLNPFNIPKSNLSGFPSVYGMSVLQAYAYFTEHCSRDVFILKYFVSPSRYHASF